MFRQANYYYLIQVIIIWLLIYNNKIDSSHFRGGTISWAPVDPSTTFPVASVPVNITMRFFWNLLTVYINVCNTPALVASGNLFGSATDPLYSLNGPYWSLSSIAHCYAYDTTYKWQANQISQTQSIITSTKVYALWTGSAWIAGVNNINGTSSWYLTVMFDLSQRADTGKINTSPVTSMVPYVLVLSNCTGNRSLTIPFYDADGDFVRCRCNYDICLSIVTLDKDNCILYFNGQITTGNYVIEIQIEDFDSSSSTTAMSSVPLVFLMSVVNTGATCCPDGTNNCLYNSTDTTTTPILSTTAIPSSSSCCDTWVWIVIGSVGGALIFCCCFMTYCAILCCRSGGYEEEVAQEGVKNIFTARKYKMKHEKKTERPITPILLAPIVTPPVVKKTFFTKLVPKLNIFKPVLRPFAPLIAKIRAVRQPQPPTLIRRPLVQATTVTPIASPSQLLVQQTHQQPPLVTKIQVPSVQSTPVYSQMIASPPQRQPQMFGTRLISNRQQQQQSITNHFPQSLSFHQNNFNMQPPQQQIATSSHISNANLISNGAIFSPTTVSPSTVNARNVLSYSNLTKSVSNPSPIARMMITSRIKPMKIDENKASMNKSQMTLDAQSAPQLVKQNSDPIYSVVKQANVRSNATYEARLNLASLKRTGSSA